MLKVFRDNLKYLSWVLWAVIAVFVLFVFVDFGGIIPDGTRPSDAAAVVGDMEVSYGEFENRYRQLEDVYRQAYGDQFSAELANQLGLPFQVLNSLVAERILHQEGEKMGLEVTDDELRSAMLEIPWLQQDGKFVGEEAYRDVLRRNRLTPEEFEESLRSDLLTEKVRAVLAETLFVSDREVEERYREQAESAEIRYLQVPTSRYAGDVVIEDGELEAYFAANSDDFRLPEQRVVSYLLVEPSALRDSVELTDDEMRTFYRDNSSQFTKEEQVKARHILLRVSDTRSEDQARSELETIRARIEGGEDFAALATELSDDPGSKGRGGDLGFFSRGAMVAEFDQAAFAAQPGQLLGPIQTTFGYHLIEVTDRQEAGTQPFEEAEASIRAQLSTEKAADLAERKASELADRVRKEKPDAEALRAIAEAEAGVTAATSPPFGREDNVPGIGRATQFTVAAFELDADSSSEAVRVPRGWTVLDLDEIRPPRIPEFAEARIGVERALRESRELDMAKQALEEAKSSLSGGVSFDDVAGSLGIDAKTAGPFRRREALGDLGTQTKTVPQALSMEVGEVAGPFQEGRDVVLFEVTARTHFEPDKFAEEKDATRGQLENQKYEELLTSLVAQRRDELGVRYDPQIFETFAQQPPAGP